LSGSLAGRRIGGLPVKGLLHLCVVYLVWGSTYLAIRVAVRAGAGFPPFTLGAMRVLIGGALLLGWAKLEGRRVAIARREAALMIAAGCLLWVGGNGGVMWAEQRAESGYAALLIGTTPLWVALIESRLDRRKPSLLLMGSLLLGLLGIAVLSAPVLRRGERGDTLAALALLLGGLSWGCGTILQRRRPVELAPRVSAGYQSLFGGIGFVLAALLLREPRPTPTPAAWLGWAYLLVFGSLLAFTSFVTAVRMLPTQVVMTYAYVNPVVAVLLGWLVLRERVTGWTLLGSAMILLSVAGVFRDRSRAARV
jgi:drug/metabolite transporter (DMT)-like permease